MSLPSWGLTMLEMVSESASRSVSDESELARTDLTLLPSEKVRPPRVAQSPAHLECRWLRTVDLPCSLPDCGNHLVIGEVVGIHPDFERGRVDQDQHRERQLVGHVAASEPTKKHTRQGVGGLAPIRFAVDPRKRGAS